MKQKKEEKKIEKCECCEEYFVNKKGEWCDFCNLPEFNLIK